jgi:hypothetical protein
MSSDNSARMPAASQYALYGSTTGADARSERLVSHK